jgi:acyl-CoA thioesterase-1
MSFARRFRPSRRALIGGSAAMLMVSGRATAAGPGKIVTLLGDSITAGLGLPASEALPAQLQAALGRLGVPARVRGAGVSGDTTADGLARVDFSVQSDTALCIVALGGNDLLQGVDPKAVQANLTAMVRRLKARRIAVLLAGMRAPPQIGRDYARAFNAAFPAAARAGGVAFYPDLLAGVGRQRQLLQADTVHPNAAGVKIIAAGLARAAAPILARP